MVERIYVKPYDKGIISLSPRGRGDVTDPSSGKAGVARGSPGKPYRAGPRVTGPVRRKRKGKRARTFGENRWLPPFVNPAWAIGYIIPHFPAPGIVRCLDVLLRCGRGPFSMRMSPTVEPAGFPRFLGSLRPDRRTGRVLKEPGGAFRDGPVGSIPLLPGP